MYLFNCNAFSFLSVNDSCFSFLKKEIYKNDFNTVHLKLTSEIHTVLKFIKTCYSKYFVQI